jgi:hypothetical protein
MKYIKEVCRKVLSVWDSRHELKARVYGNDPVFKRRRNIMYDTDGIFERQFEHAKNCDKCGGALKISSESDRGWKVTAVHAPVNVCDKCLEQAEKWYEDADSEISFFHDNRNDRFERKKR